MVTYLTPFARASYYNFQCGNLTQIEFFDRIDGTWPRGLNFKIVGPVVLRIQSPGGLIDNEEQFMNRLRILADQVFKKSGIRLKVVVANNCASACTILTAGLNSLAGLGKLDLLIDSRLQLGFHAGFAPLTQTVVPASQLEVYYSKYGVSKEWFFQNKATFSTLKLKWVSPSDPWLAGSQLLNHAIFPSIDETDFPIPADANCIPGPTE